MNTPIGKAKELPDHFKEGSNDKACIVCVFYMNTSLVCAIHFIVY